MNLKIAVAQIISKRGEVDKNINVHIKAIKRASELNISYLVFPELSLMGYEPDLASQLAFSKDDVRLKPLIDAAIKYQIHIAVGAPLKSEKLPQIGLIMIDALGEIQSYQKMHLHGSEENFFSPGNKHHSLTFKDTKIANAICADTNHPIHCQYCFELGASVYIAGSMISDGGYKADTDVLQSYAQKYNILVALANYSSKTGKVADGWQPIGKSAIWSKQGLLVVANETQSALIIAEKVANKWVGEVVDLD